MRDVYAGPPHDEHARGEGARAALRQARPVDDYPPAQPRRDLQQQIPDPTVNESVGTHRLQRARRMQPRVPLGPRRGTLKKGVRFL